VSAADDAPGARPGAVTCLPVDGVGEVTAGADLAAVLTTASGSVTLHDGDILVVTSKVVSKAEGRVQAGTREQALEQETVRTVARRGRTSIVRTRHGLVMAAAGVDASNVEAGSVVLLPLDPDSSARRLREDLRRTTGRNVAVVVTDTAGRAWRTGQTDIAVGAAGLDVLHHYAGVRDSHGNELAVTEPAVADELAAAADLVKRKLDRRPAAVVRGLAALVLEPGQHGDGAVALVRDESQDMFGLGAREAVLAALHGTDPSGFGAACSAAELVEHLSSLGGGSVVRIEGEEELTVRLAGTEREQGAATVRLQAAAFALGWRTDPDAPSAASVARFRRGTP
jgi:coenzyme F420-0:L-glutamate ligase/coenzyme F420-1:gamma-L-glutamate ligase